MFFILLTFLFLPSHMLFAKDLKATSNLEESILMWNRGHIDDSRELFANASIGDDELLSSIEFAIILEMEDKANELIDSYISLTGLPLDRKEIRRACLTKNSDDKLEQASRLLATSEFLGFIEANFIDEKDLIKLAEVMSLHRLNTQEEKLFFEIADKKQIARYLLNGVLGPQDREGYGRYFEFLDQVDLEPFLESSVENIYHLFRKGKVLEAMEYGEAKIEELDGDSLHIYIALGVGVPDDFSFNSPEDHMQYLKILHQQRSSQLRHFAKRFIEEYKYTLEDSIYKNFPSHGNVQETRAVVQKNLFAASVIHS